MSERFCPVIGNFELAVRVFDNDNNKVALTDACQISAGNSNAWSPELLLSKTREHQLVAQNVSVCQMKKYKKYLFIFLCIVHVHSIIILFDFYEKRLIA